MTSVSHAFAFVHCCLVVNCWEWADLIVTLVGYVYCIFVPFSCGILGQVWYLIVIFFLIIAVFLTFLTYLFLINYRKLVILFMVNYQD